MRYTVQICPAYTLEEMKNCAKDHVILTNVSSKAELKEFLKIAFREHSKTAFIIISKRTVPIEDSIELPVIWFLKD